MRLLVYITVYMFMDYLSLNAVLAFQINHDLVY